jgi:hypothetical protein
VSKLPDSVHEEGSSFLCVLFLATLSYTKIYGVDSIGIKLEYEALMEDGDNLKILVLGEEPATLPFS